MIWVGIVSIPFFNFSFYISINQNKNIQWQRNTEKGRKADDIRKQGCKHQPTLRDSSPGQIARNHHSGVQLWRGWWRGKPAEILHWQATEERRLLSVSGMFELYITTSLFSIWSSKSGFTKLYFKRLILRILKKLPLSTTKLLNKLPLKKPKTLFFVVHHQL